MSDLSYIPWSKLQGKTLFVTGATGLIGSALISLLARENDSRDLHTRIIALVRDERKAMSDIGQHDCVSLVRGNVETLSDIQEPVDYIVHAASTTLSRAFVERPVEVIEASVLGTSNVLKLARAKDIEGLAYLSSMEVYGHPTRGRKVLEGDVGSFDVTEARSSYPLSKIMCENLCMSYVREYRVPANVLRLTQTFGPGARLDDRRVFAEFARNAVEGNNIVLKTEGKTERSYLYTEDAATAILAVLLSGRSGEIYNVANEDSYCSIADMAELVADMSGVQVEYDIQDTSKMGFAGTLYLDLDTSKLRSLGWRPTVSLTESFSRLIDYYISIRTGRR